MAYQNGPKIVTSNLVFCLDAGNRKSYPGSGATWTNLIGNGINGTLENTPTFNSDDGGSIVFDGTDDFINFSTYNFGNEITISCFFRPSLIANIQTIFANTGAPLTPPGFKFYFNSYYNNTRAIYIELGNNTTGAVPVNTANSIITYNVWQHAACTLSKTTGIGKIYYNGNLAASNALGITNYDTNRAFRIGRFPSGNELFPLNGRISHYCIYNRALSDAEILQNYNAIRGRHKL
jgi:hypothetical protein